MTDFWAGRRVLVTGHTGFKGGWLALWLRELGATVTGFGGPPPTDPALFELARVADGLEDLRGDVRDRAAEVGAAVETARPEVVLHLAAQPLVRRAWREPVDAFAVNALGTAHVLEAVRRHAPEAPVVVVTTDKVYADPDSGRRFAEGDPLGGKDPYSASKAAAELVATALPRLLRPAGRDGPRRQRDRRRRLGRGPHPARRRPRRRGGPAARGPRPGRGPPVAARPQPAVRLPAARRAPGRVGGLRAGLELRAAAGARAAPGRVARRALRRRARRACRSRRPSSATDRSRRPGSGSIRRWPPSALGWRERWALERGCRETAAWYRRVVFEGADARAVTLEQLRAFGPPGWRRRTQLRLGREAREPPRLPERDGGSWPQARSTARSSGRLFRLSLKN